MECCKPDNFPTALRSLLTPVAYSHPVRSVELVETHISWILLTGEFAYKIKRPVQYAFIDMRALERRAFLCLEELRLNRRFAPELYLEVCSITSKAGVAHIGGEGEIIEHAVRMRQFNRQAELDRLLVSGDVQIDELETFGRTLADIHAGLPAATTAEPWGYPAQIRTLILKNVAECAHAGVIQRGSAELNALQPMLERMLHEAEPCLSARRASSRVRECHGDLHSRNVVRLDTRLCAFDCMEFEPAFRWIDVADEISLLLADLDARGFPEHAYAFLRGYLLQSGDYQACRLLDLYKTHRALVRAKVAALQSVGAVTNDAQKQLRAEQARLVDCALQALKPRVPQLLLMCGVAGSGKTWLAQRLAPPLRAVLLRSDVERKRRAGLDLHARSNSALEQGLYSAQSSADLYEYLARCAQDILFGGYTTIIDASFARRADRARFQRLAAQLGVDVRIIHCHASHELLHQRVLQRRHAGLDESEADVQVLDWQLKHFEPIGDDENLAVIGLDSGEPDALSELLRRCASVGLSQASM